MLDLSREIFEESGVRVKYHVHITDKYHESTHQDCNVKLSLSETIPVVFYNF